MRRNKGDSAFLYDMLQAAGDVHKFLVGKSQNDYQADDLLRAAIERKIEIIGEGARGLSKEFCDANPSIPWKKIKATRHILAHDYDTVNHLTVWRIATTHVPELVILLTPLLPQLPPDPRPEEE